MRRQQIRGRPGLVDAVTALGAHRIVALLGLAATLALPPTFAATLAGVAGMVGEEPIEIITAPRGLDEAKVELGRKLFHDPRLSGDESVACATCHDLARGGDDGQVRSMGADGRPLKFNTPTVFNAALNFRLNWRGNFRRLEAQNEAALLDPEIMAVTWAGLLPKLTADPDYSHNFRTIYGHAPRREQVLDALAAFQRSLVTPDARFDRYLTGEDEALTSSEVRGYELFKAYGCSSCHQGRNVGGNLFQRFGVFANPRLRRDAHTETDLGRFTITGLDSDRHVFRVPSLRNVAVTAPYLHDGSAATLSEAVGIMGRSQLGIDLPPRDVGLIVEFLRTLTGEYRGRPLLAADDPAP